MEKLLMPFMALIFVVPNLNGQSISRDLISSQGGVSSSNSISLHWTLGDNYVETVNAFSSYVTEGFVQPILAKRNFQESSLYLEVFPNPTQALIYLRCRDNEVLDLKLELFTAAGNLIMQRRLELQSEPNTLNLESLARGLYFLKATNRSNGETNTYTITKL